MELPKRAKEFYRIIVLDNPDNYDVWIPFTQGWHESRAYIQWVGKNNCFGIKTPVKWNEILYDRNIDEEKKKFLIGVMDKPPDNQFVRTVTSEYINGENKVFRDYFRDWDKPEQCLDYYFRLIERLYPAAFENRKDYKKYFTELVNKANKYRWATDPLYAEKLTGIYEKIHPKYGNWLGTQNLMAGGESDDKEEKESKESKETGIV